MSEAFVKTLKRDYARVQPRLDADTVLDRIGAWITDYNENHPHRDQLTLLWPHPHMLDAVLQRCAVGQLIQLPQTAALLIPRNRSKRAGETTVKPATVKLR